MSQSQSMISYPTYYSVYRANVNWRRGSDGLMSHAMFQLSLLVYFDVTRLISRLLRAKGWTIAYTLFLTVETRSYSSCCTLKVLNFVSSSETSVPYENFVTHIYRKVHHFCAKTIFRLWCILSRLRLACSNISLIFFLCSWTNSSLFTLLTDIEFDTVDDTMQSTGIFDLRQNK